ncbi:MAG: HAMP domain-containing histidine kinase [Pyrinomonadaceae bacterium]|nr:HAMP domain-containing histidine kinase [Pyrinomonadaceae bacterium]
MRVASRRKAAIVFLVLGICLVVLTVALNVGWILLNLQQIALLVFGVIVFAIIITGLVLNTIFLVREIRRNEQHDAFLNAVTHELKTPIASIRLYLETLQTREVREEKRQEFYNIMLADSDRLLNTVEQVLKASSTREKNNLLNISDINLAELLRDAVELVRTRYDLSDGAISFSQTNAEIKVTGDTDELRTVFTNLLDNAVKYSGKEMKISVAVKSLNEKIVIVRIKDDGIGISPAELKRIFKRFYRAPNVQTQKRKGTGLGLFIVRSIIKKHGGRISAESRGDGAGSTFIIQLPKSRSKNLQD